ncbi:MAG: hypothetical protein ACOYKN_01925 [Pirellula sp.]
MHKSTTTRKLASKRQRRGLILLLALGMLALFSLLAVTWVVSASSSRAGAQAMRIRANQSNASVKGMASEVMKLAVRGTRDQKSAFYMHSLLDDIYDPNGIRVQFGHRFYGAGIDTFQDKWCRKLTPVGGTGIELLKVSIDPRNLNNLSGGYPSYQLSPIEGAYNGRVLTVLEGPLAGLSFRIVKYVGFVRSPNDSVADPNIDGNMPGNMPGSYPQSVAYDYDYSVVVDLSSIKGKLEGKWRNPSSTRIENFSGELGDWMALPNNQGLRNLFFFYEPGTQQYQGYRCMINGAAFNNAAIGLETNSSQLGFGNIDGRNLMRIPTSKPKIPPALLPNYDYLQHPDFMATNGGIVGVSGVGDQGLLKGYSNEGIDVPDWRDFWLSYTDSNVHLPSFHRPDLIHYLSNVFGPPNNATEASELLRLLDASTARVMSYSYLNGNVIASVNPYFQPHGAFPSYPSESFAANAPLTPYIQQLISGTWDVDNDGDGFPDSVWINPNLPAIHAPDGRLLKPLTAVMIQDLDGRLNINLHGDRIQGSVVNNFNGSGAGFNAFGYSNGLHRIGVSLPQGFGYGPADISLNPLFGNNASLLTSNSGYSIFDLRYGARPYANLGFNPQIDRSPGRPGNDPLSVLMERELPLNGVYGHGTMPGAPMGRRSSVAPTFDKHGNLVFLYPQVPDAAPESGVTQGFPSETVGDAYESGSGLRDYGDTPFTLSDLEAILRRYDEDVESLPSELRARLVASGFGSASDVNKLLTTHSAELRYPKLSAAAMVPNASNGYDLRKDAGNLMGLIRMLHEQRYRKRSLPNQNTSGDEYALSVESLNELFPPEFSMNLRLNLNRPFGNGVDRNNDGQIDEPFEIAFFNDEVEPKWDYASGSKVSSGVAGTYTRGLNLRNSNSRPYLGSRQLLARYLYCLAQLIVPRDHLFPNMETISNAFLRDKLRARSLAQWAVNVVDFRDTDAAMTRFEYDVYPFGVRSGPLDRPAFWAPDRLINSGNVTINSSLRPYIGVVWGMEQPELLLTESLAFHDKRLRDTNLDNGSGKELGQGDNDTDQYRFPQGSLILELYAPRSTYVSTDPVLPGAPPSLYTVDANNGNRVKLLLNKTAPPSQAWGAQPVWRIGITDSTPLGSSTRTKNPNVLYQSNDSNSNRLAWLDPQFAEDSDLNGDQNNGNPEYNVGSGLFQTLNNNSTNTEVFERMIWFTQQSARSVPRVPNLQGNDNQQQNANREFMVYYNRSTQQGDPLMLEGGNYMVVGPRTETNIGSLTSNPTTGAAWPSTLLKNQAIANPPVHSPSHQTISLGNSSVTTTLINGESITRYRPDWVNKIKSPTGVVCAAEPPPSTGGNGTDPTWRDCFPNGVGINVSMPNPIANEGYWKPNLRPTKVLNSQDRRQQRQDNRWGYQDLAPDSWVDFANIGTSTFPDNPFDHQPSVNPILNPNNLPPMYKTGTYDNVRTACLQRLADPDFPYDPINNPYITIDWISIDLTVFNGEAPRDPGDVGPNMAFQSRYKDGSTRNKAANKATLGNGQPAGNPGLKDWGFSYHSASTAQMRTTPYQSFVPPNPVPGNGRPFDRYSSYFMAQLGYASQQPDDNDMTQVIHHSATTLGYANVGYRFQNLLGAANDTADQFDGFGPPQFVQNQPEYVGSPRDLTSPVWLNRTFATANELMLVPLTSPGQFGYYFEISDDKTARTPFGFLPSFQASNGLVTNLESSGSNDLADYSPTDASAANTARLSGYWMRRAGDWSTTSPKPKTQADWGLILEFVETPTAYSDTVKQLDLEKLQLAAFPGGNMDPWATRFLASFIPENFTGSNERESFRGPSLLGPYNQLPSYVSPGKVNLNTIGSAKVVQGLEYLFTGTTERQASQNGLATQFFSSRRGFAGNNTSSINLSFPGMDPNYPTMFAGAYRSGLATNLYPFAPNQDGSNRPQTIQRGRFASESTTLRSLVPNPTGNEQPNGPNNGNLLFSPYSLANAEAGISIPGGQLDTPGTLEYAEARQNAFTRYQRAMRLSNLTTDQSNVFAMWVTVALFEYDPVTGFGKEYSNSAGEPERERAFYIIDRTVPVGFLPGEDLNSDKAVLLKRTINSKRR